MTDQPDSAAWRRVDTPVDETLYDAADAGGTPVAVGGGGTALRRADGDWHAVLEDGVAANGYALCAADATDAGDRVWVAGESGAFGTYELGGARTHDYSAPGGNTTTFVAVAAVGDAGSETVFVGDDDGAVTVITPGGGSPTVDRTTRPPNGDEIVGIGARGDDAVVVTGDGFLCRTADGRDWSTTDLGTALETTVAAGAAAADRTVAVSHEGDGCVVTAAGDVLLDSLAGTDVSDVATDGAEVVTVGGSGGVYRRTLDGYVVADTATDATLHGVALSDPAVAVGSSGTVLEATNAVPLASDN
ncbi:hypothetical protein [Halobaculum sp. D14]|uniref:hypothetical protein n=1 Tax=Halobaculum sp. D14 TaxID=3421642 RepID=UPI003EC017A8